MAFFFLRKRYRIYPNYVLRIFSLKLCVMNYIRLGVVLLLLASCGTTRVVHDYDEQQDFSVYKTFDFYPEMQSGLNELDQNRLLRVTEQTMVDRGFTKSDNPDIYINFKTTTFKEASQNSIGVGVGTGGNGVGIGVGGSIPIGRPQIFLELTVDFVDVKKDALVWQAIANKRYNPNASPNTKTYFFQAVLEKSFSKYPPE